jgi:hypothetical protein
VTESPRRRTGSRIKRRSEDEKVLNRMRSVLFY